MTEERKKHYLYARVEPSVMATGNYTVGGMTEELKPCPFCGGETKVAETIAHYVKCKECLAFGPTGLDNLDGVHKWNYRHETSDKSSAATLAQLSENIRADPMYAWAWVKATVKKETA